MSRLRLDTAHLLEKLDDIDPVTIHGRITQLIGLVLEAEGCEASIGELCYVEPDSGSEPILAEVVGFTKGNILLMPFQNIEGIRPGYKIRPSGSALKVPVGEGLLGRVLDGMARPIDGKGPLEVETYRPTNSLSPRPLERRRIDQILTTGVKAIDGCHTCGCGQRMGIFSGSGVGKSTLLGMICRNSSSDVNVVAMVGERGREVREFVENNLGEKGLKRTVVVAVTSDESPLMRIKGAQTAMTVAEYFRDRRKDVTFLMDSVTRYAMALREVGLSAGEVPTARGYTPSVFAKLPALLERAGTSPLGSITGFFSVLVEGDEIKNDPVTDALRAILDGHVVLSRKLANINVFPPIDMLQSISRLSRVLLGPKEQERMDRMLDLLATYTESEDLINIGAYAAGSSPKIDEAIQKIEAIRNFIKQDISETFSLEETQKLMAEITGIT